MGDAKLKFDGRERMLAGGITTIGRTPDNAVSFPDDSRVSRFHAEIEERGGEYWLTDVGSSNGTTLNGAPVDGPTPLSHGDIIHLGNSAEIVVELRKEERLAESPSPATPAVNAPSADVGGLAADAVRAQSAAASPGSGGGLIIAGAVVCCLVLLLAAGGVAYYLTRVPKCEAKAQVIKPEQGETLLEAAEIELDIENAGCVERVVFTLDGQEFAFSDEPPYTASIDPGEMPELADGMDHSLGVTLLDGEGKVISNAPGVLLAFETRQVARPAEKEVVAVNTQPQPQAPKSKEVSLIEVQEMSKRLVKQFSGSFSYNVSNKQFLQEVQKRTGEYAQEGYFERAARYRDVINVAYAREQNVDAALGFILAMSRSKFDPGKQGADVGLWRMSDAFVTANAYNGLCGSETLADPLQNCAAKASALYMKAIVFGVFDGDAIYSAAAFGKSPQDAGLWKASLPANRADVWNSIKTPQERDQIVRFFAAGIVAENPQKFGLKRDRPLSELYRLTM